MGHSQHVIVKSHGQGVAEENWDGFWLICWNTSHNGQGATCTGHSCHITVRSHGQWTAEVKTEFCFT